MLWIRIRMDPELCLDLELSSGSGSKKSEGAYNYNGNSGLLYYWTVLNSEWQKVDRDFFLIGFFVLIQNKVN